MPLDPRIIQQAVPAPAPPFDPLRAMGQVYNLQAAQQAQQVHQLQLADAQRQEQERRDLGAIYRRHVVTDPTTGQATLDLPGAMTEAYRVNPVTAFKMQQEYTKTRAETTKTALEAQKQQTEQALKGLEFGGQVAQGVEDRIAAGADPQEAWQWGLETMRRGGLPTEGITPTYDATMLAGWKGQALQLKDKLTAQQKAIDQQLREQETVTQRRGQDITVRGQDLTAQTQQRGQDITVRGQDLQAENRGLQREKLQLEIDQAKRDASGALSPADQRKVSLDLRQNIRQEPSFKIFTQVRNGVQNVEVGAGRQDAAGDLAIVNGYAKILDPEGVVRPEEFKTVEASQGFFERFLAIPGKIWQGDRLLPDVRARFLDAARQLGTEKQTTARQELSTVYEPLARDAGLDFGQLLPLQLGQGGTTGAGTGGGTAGSPAAAPRRYTRQQVEQKLKPGWTLDQAIEYYRSQGIEVD